MALKNAKPEKLVQIQIGHAMAKENIFCWDIESKANFSVAKKGYSRSCIPVGHPDKIGVNPAGRMVAVECKAPGRRSNVSLFQYRFLCTLINSNAFAMVADSDELFTATYRSWMDGRLTQADLLGLLPRP